MSRISEKTAMDSLNKLPFLLLIRLDFGLDCYFHTQAKECRRNDKEFN